MDKHVLLDFTDEEMVDVGETAWLEISEDEFEDMNYIIGKTVTCNWQEKKRCQAMQTTLCSACFGDDDEDDDEEEVAKEIEKTKKESVKKSASQLRQVMQSKSKDTALLAENLQLKEKIKSLEKLAERLTQTISCMDHLPKLLDRMKQAPQAEHIKPIEKQYDEPSTEEVTLAGTLKVPKNVVSSWKKTNINKYTADALLYFFSREEMASHSLSGAKSNAHKDKNLKPALNKDVVKPLITHIRTAFSAEESVVKQAIRSKLNTESKLFAKQSI